MRTIALVSITLATLSMSIIGARADGSWCANYGGRGGTNCGFYSYHNAWLRFRGLADFARKICSTGLQGTRDGAISAIIRNARLLQVTFVDQFRA
jgi:hypothetical protein